MTITLADFPPSPTLDELEDWTRDDNIFFPAPKAAFNVKLCPTRASNIVRGDWIYPDGNGANGTNFAPWLVLQVVRNYSGLGTVSWNLWPGDSRHRIRFPSMKFVVPSEKSVVRAKWPHYMLICPLKDSMDAMELIEDVVDTSYTHSTTLAIDHIMGKMYSPQYLEKHYRNSVGKAFYLALTPLQYQKLAQSPYFDYIDVTSSDRRALLND